MNPETTVRNNLADLRHKRGLGVAEMAARIGVSRQTVYSMEAGSFVPNTLVALRIARTLGVRVEDLFELEPEAPEVQYASNVELLPGAGQAQPGQPVQLCQVGRHLVAVRPELVNWSLPPADGVLTDTGPKSTVQLLHDEKEFGKRILVAGCDPGMSVLARHMQRSGADPVLLNCNSSQSLDLLKQGLVHVAGTHLRDAATGESNLPAVRRRFASQSVAVVAFALWEEGIVVARGNPKGITSLSGLARRDVAIVNREPGAGCRDLLDTQLAKAGIAAKLVRGYNNIATGHLPAAWHVHTGAADCCVATRAAARVFGLDFIPLLTERYDLVIRKADLKLPGMQVLLETMGRAAFRRELESLGGYDTRSAGDRLA